MIGRPSQPATASATVLAPSPQGLHARPAARVVETARRFAAETILVVTPSEVASRLPDDRPSNGHGDSHGDVPSEPVAVGRAKDLLDVLALGVMGGTRVVIEGRGEDAAAAVAALEALFAEFSRE